VTECWSDIAMVDSEMIAPETIPNPTASARTDIACGFPAGDLTQAAGHPPMITDTPHSGLPCHLVGYIRGGLIPCQELRNSQIEAAISSLAGCPSPVRCVLERRERWRPPSSGKRYRRRLYPRDVGGPPTPSYAAPICIHQKLIASTAGGRAAPPGSRRAQREPT
jgi:hypothetical protein